MYNYTDMFNYADHLYNYADMFNYADQLCNYAAHMNSYVDLMYNYADYITTTLQPRYSAVFGVHSAYPWYKWGAVRGQGVKTL